MRTFTAREAYKKFGALLEAADAGPVAILKAGRPRAVVLSARRFEDYQKAYDKENEERFADLIQLSLDLLKEDKLGKGQRALALARRLRLHEERPGDARAAAALKAEQSKTEQGT
jgi:prevent-host-death family protein